MQRPDYDSEFSGPLSDVDQRRPKVSEQPPGRAEPDFKRAARGVESLIRVEEHFDASRGGTKAIKQFGLQSDRIGVKELSLVDSVSLPTDL